LIKETIANFDIYVQEVRVTGTGTSTPPGQRFPGAYHWRDPGILYNTKYGPNKYVGFCSFIDKPFFQAARLTSINRMHLGYLYTRAAKGSHYKAQSQ
jgi:hypothetical protein